VDLETETLRKLARYWGERDKAYKRKLPEDWKYDAETEFQLAMSHRLEMAEVSDARLENTFNKVKGNFPSDRDIIALYDSDSESF